MANTFAMKTNAINKLNRIQDSTSLKLNGFEQLDDTNVGEDEGNRVGDNVGEVEDVLLLLFIILAIGGIIWVLFLRFLFRSW